MPDVAQIVRRKLCGEGRAFFPVDRDDQDKKHLLKLLTFKARVALAGYYFLFL